MKNLLRKWKKEWDKVNYFLLKEIYRWESLIRQGAINLLKAL